MKKIILILASLLILASCNRTTTTIGGKVPFVVDQIKKVDDELKMSEYRSTGTSSKDYDIVISQYIILPIGMFNIGDTIKINFFIKDSINI